MKTLLIGLGRWGEKHLRVLTELGAEVWVADVSEERRAFAVKAGVDPRRVVDDHRAALPHVDAVDLVTPADSHLALAGECLRAGRAAWRKSTSTIRAGMTSPSDASRAPTAHWCARHASVRPWKKRRT